MKRGLRRAAAALLLLAAASPSMAVETGWLTGAGGIRLGFRRRNGSGTPVLLVHGRSLGTETFSAWEKALLPGRTLFILERRGYAPSEGGGGAPLERLNAEDVARAVELAAKDSPDGRVGFVAYSLAARFLGAVPSGRLRWVALVNPAAVPLAGHLPPREAAQAWLLAQGDVVSRLWAPGARRDWERAAAGAISEGTATRLREQGASEELVRLVESRLDAPGFGETLIAETLLGAFGSPPAWNAAGVPFLLVASDADELVPAAATDALSRALSAAGVTVLERRLPGGHLAPALAPGPWLREIELLDAGSR